MSKVYSLNDEVWHKVVQVVQLAMLTGIDVVDYFRQIRVVESSQQDSDLVLSESYKVIFDKTIEDLQHHLENQMKQMKQDDPFALDAPIMGIGEVTAPGMGTFQLPDDLKNRLT